MQETRNSALPLDLDDDSSSQKSHDTDKRKSRTKRKSRIGNSTTNIAFPLADTSSSISTQSRDSKESTPIPEEIVAVAGSTPIKRPVVDIADTLPEKSADVGPVSAAVVDVERKTVGSGKVLNKINVFYILNLYVNLLKSSNSKW